MCRIATRERFSAQFVHPLLVAMRDDYSPVNGDGPSFRQDFLLTPDGILATRRLANAKEFGVTAHCWRMTEHPSHSDHPIRQRTVAIASTPTNQLLFVGSPLERYDK